MGIEPCTDWFQVQKTQVGANKTFHWMFIKYLISKTQSELQWAWSNSEDYKEALLPRQKHKGLFEQHKQESFTAKKERVERGTSDSFAQPFYSYEETTPTQQSCFKENGLQSVKWL